MKANNLDWYLPNFNFGCSDFDFRFTHSRIYEVRNFPARPRLPRGMPCAVLWWAKHSTELSLSRLSSYLHYRSVFTRTFIIILSAYRPTLSRPPPPSLPEVDARPPLTHSPQEKVGALTQCIGLKNGFLPSADAIDAWLQTIEHNSRRHRSVHLSYQCSLVLPPAELLGKALPI